jgi:DNA polymerase (family 10)
MCAGRRDSVDNTAVARVFREIGDLLEAKKESYFKIRAYRQVADRIEELPVDLRQVAEEGRLREIPGVGEAIEKKISELLTTGRLEFLERLRSEIVDGVSREPC